ncbi:glycoside hydrolase family 61 protein [Choiromyces venosus 120613-1]|uniref:AA9 family lytic polysaccharide monooxygenase n=1 Tax=Choiromyces venosus 120613-1 TaxID=1336337 RepID=A0A3N4J7Y6_9PEZI|nr:glycoside hydrolase family 61 protein [Choiromyces venosus 120613-1]
MKSSIAVLAALAGSSYAHNIFQELYPITDMTPNDIICNGGINPYRTPLPTDIITVPAGATVTTEWHHTLAGANSADGDDPISPGHFGQVMVHLAKVDISLTTTVTGLKWFKIYEDCLDSSSVWAVTRLVNKGKVAAKIPSCILGGNYLLRAKLIALYGASSYPDVQFYLECAQINVTGGGSVSPATVSFPGAYLGSDPGVTINIYWPVVTSYTIPGPRLFTC